MIGLLAVLAYLLGSIPVAWGLTRLATGQDLQAMGSGNVGVMNVMIHVSRWAGLLLFLAEALKGVLAVALARAVGGGELATGVAVLAVVVGTRWPVWLRFHGGRGNTTGMGALLAISWPTLLACALAWGLLRGLTRDSFLATRLTLVSAPVIFGLITGSALMGVLGIPLCLVYLSTQVKQTDDHLLIRQRWSSFWGFLTTAPRQKDDKRIP